MGVISTQQTWANPTQHNVMNQIFQFQIFVI